MKFLILQYHTNAIYHLYLMLNSILFFLIFSPVTLVFKLNIGFMASLILQPLGLQLLGVVTVRLQLLLA